MPTIIHRLNLRLLFDGTLGQGGWIAMEEATFFSLNTFLSRIRCLKSILQYTLELRVLLMIRPHGHQLGQTTWPNANNKQELHY